jgi:hypothetical protein
MAVYEFLITDLIASDERWGQVWEEFLQSCTVPQQPLPHHSLQEYQRNRFSPPQIFSDTVREIWLKIRRRAIHRPRRGRRDARPIGGGEGHQDDEEGWYPSDGKYCRQQGHNAHTATALRVLNQIFREDIPPQRGNFYYPSQGYREWHTNQFDRHGWRLYLVHTEPSGCALFRYKNRLNREERGRQEGEEQEVVDCRDEDGVARLFEVRGGQEALWHCIVSEGHRWSLGVILSDRAAQRLIEMSRQRREEDGKGGRGGETEGGEGDQRVLSEEEKSY